MTRNHPLFSPIGHDAGNQVLGIQVSESEIVPQVGEMGGTTTIMAYKEEKPIYH